MEDLIKFRGELTNSSVAGARAAMSGVKTTICQTAQLMIALKQMRGSLGKAVGDVRAVSEAVATASSLRGRAQDWESF